MEDESIKSARYDPDQLREEVVFALTDGGSFTPQEKQAIRNLWHRTGDHEKIRMAIKDQTERFLKYPPENPEEAKEAIYEGFKEVFGEPEGNP